MGKLVLMYMHYMCEFEKEKLDYEPTLVMYTNTVNSYILRKKTYDLNKTEKKSRN